MSTTLRSLLLMLSLLLPALSLNAAPVSAMYQGVVPVLDQSIEARQAALGAALEQVLVRLSGQQQVADAAGVAHAMRQADSYMLRYGYETRNNGNNQQTLLKVQFDESLTKALMRHAQLPMWIVGRPTVMLWVAIEQAGERLVVNPETAPEIADELGREFTRRGLPYVWPTLDIIDYQALSIDELWALDADKLLAATARYGHPVVFAGRVQQGELAIDTDWQGHWIMLGQNEQRLLQKGEGLSLAAFSAPAVDDLTDSLAKDYGVQVRGGEVSAVSLAIEGITAFADYQQVLQQLQAMGLVRNVGVSGVDAGRLQLQLQLEGSVEQFVDAMQLQQQLQAVDTRAMPLVYRLFDETNTDVDQTLEVSPGAINAEG